LPLLANDPHLQLGAPGVWYLMRLNSPHRALVGATAPGVPGVVLGHNGKVAWGMTTTGADTFDVFVERVVPGDPTRYAIAGGAAEFATRRHSIAIKGESEPHQLTTRWTYHGLIISDFVPEAERASRSGHVLALSSTLFVDANRTPDALFAINAASDVDAVLAALEDWHAPVQNLFVADVKGKVALAVAGRVPRRRAGDGWMPQPGWTAEHDWDGMIASSSLPRMIDPADGILLNANNRVSGSEEPFISRDWDAPFRARRVAAALAAVPAHDLGTLQRAQTDIVSSFAQDFMARLEDWKPADHEIRYYLDALREWDGAARRNLMEPLIFNTWMRVLRRNALETLLGSDLPLFGGSQRDLPHVLLAIAAQQGAICAKVDCVELLETSLREAVSAIQRRYSGDRGAWRWARAHAAAFRHAVFSRIPVFSQLAAFNVTTDGDNYTINRGTAGSGGALVDFPHLHGPTLRALYDLSNLGRSRFMIAPGQSGHPLSPHWGDLAARWANGRYIEIAGSKDELLRAEGRLLVLAPR
jgi:penicillin amidase